jgi:hypothetical protein
VKVSYRDVLWLVILGGIIPAMSYLLLHNFAWRKQLSYLTALWVVAWLGVIPALLFLATHIPSKGKRWSMQAIDASSWVAIIALLYIWTMYRFATVPSTYQRDWSTQTYISILFGVVLDAALWLRFMHWLRYRKSERERYARAEETEAKHKAEHP